jgi:acylphosphatase
MGDDTVPTDERERLQARIVGRVQGVGFRYWAYRQADRLGLVGWVRNSEDRRVVELAAEGPRSALDELECLLRAGPPGARIERVEARREPPRRDETRFVIGR